MSGQPGRTGTPKWKKDLEECDKKLRKTLKKGHLERSYEELSRTDPVLHAYWEQNGSTLIDLILKGPLRFLRNFIKQKRSILAFVKWWPVEFGDISVPLLRKCLLRLKRGQMLDIKDGENILRGDLEKIIKKKEHWHSNRKR